MTWLFALGLAVASGLVGYWLGRLHEFELHPLPPPPDVHIHVVRDPDSGQLTSDVTELTRGEPCLN